MMKGVSVPHGLRLEVSHFDRKYPTGCIFKAIHYFDFHQMPTSKILLMISYHMEGGALVWYQDVMDGGMFSRLDSYVNALQVRFIP